jgi:hypothetical protein
MDENGNFVQKTTVKGYFMMFFAVFGVSNLLLRAFCAIIY